MYSHINKYEFIRKYLTYTMAQDKNYLLALHSSFTETKLSISKQTSNLPIYGGETSKT